MTLPAEPDLDSIAESKRAARAAAKAVRASVDPAGAGQALADLFDETFPDLPTGVTVSAFWPRGDEIDTRPLLTRLARRGLRTALPVVAGRSWPLVFRLWRDGHPLVPGGFGVMVPMAEAPVVQPDLLLVPMLSWDRQGWRLGYGAGFYDRTLAALREEGAVTAVGVAYAAQEVPAVPRDEYDQPLDWVLTERFAVRIGKS